MKLIRPEEIRDNIFSAINDEWMLVTAVNSKGEVNTMTASWGGFGIMWNKPVCVCVIRPQRYTSEFVKDSERISLSFLFEGNKEALKICGTKSGRDCDKIKEAGLKVIAEDDVAYFDKSRLVIVGKKIYVSSFKEENFLDKSIIDSKYPSRDYHDVYVCEIEKVLVSEA